MKNRCRILLSNLGYDMRCVGAVFFSDLVMETYELLKEGRSEDEVRDLLPCIYLENYHFDYGVGRKVYFAELNKFLDSKSISKKNKKIYRQISVLNKNLSLEELIILLSKYFYEVEVGKIEEIKVLKKILVK